MPTQASMASQRIETKRVSGVGETPAAKNRWFHNLWGTSNSKREGVSSKNKDIQVGKKEPLSLVPKTEEGGEGRVQHLESKQKRGKRNKKDIGAGKIKTRGA